MWRDILRNERVDQNKSQENKGKQNFNRKFKELEYSIGNIYQVNNIIMVEMWKSKRKKRKKRRKRRKKLTNTFPEKWQKQATILISSAFKTKEQKERQWEVDFSSMTPDPNWFYN